jgi:hypothetical protein
MATELDTLAGDAEGATDPQAGDDYASLLDASSELDIPEPDEEGEEAADDAAEGETEGKPSDGQGAIADDAKVELDGRQVSIAELKETFSTFQRKASEYAEADQQREVQAREAVASVQEQAAQQIAAIAQGINDLVLPGVDLQYIARLRQEEPTKAGELWSHLQIVEGWKTDMLRKANELWQQSLTHKQEAERTQASSRSELVRAEAEKLSGEKWWGDDFRIKAVSFLKSHGVPEQFAAQIPYAGAMRIIHKAMAFDAAQKKLKDGKQPSQSAQVPASGKARDASSKQRADGLFAMARKNPDNRRLSARAYSSLLGDK